MLGTARVGNLYWFKRPELRENTILISSAPIIASSQFDAMIFKRKSSRFFMKGDFYSEGISTK